MIFDVVSYTLGVDPLKSMGAISIHVSVTIWGSSVREKDCDLMQSLWSVLPEVENHVRIS